MTSEIEQISLISAI